ncbi:MAG TPA: SBBP repeat-containing protein [Bryobacteraceae bacterium]|nr:SBBP repeat-containing protein [Bryobacteraceae bacterium]
MFRFAIVLAILPAAAQVASHGPGVIFSTEVRGTGDSAPVAIALDAAGNTYVAGTVVTPGKTCRVALTRLDTAGNIVWNKVFGGSACDQPNAVAVDPLGNVYVAGQTTSADFPTLNAFDAQMPAGGTVLPSGFVTAFSPDGSNMLYSTYIDGRTHQGSSGTAVTALFVDGAGNATLAGYTDSSDFPVSAGACQPVLEGSIAGFVAHLSPDGATLSGASYFGNAAPAAVAIDASGNYYLASAASVAKLNPAAATLLWSEPLSVPGSTIQALALDATGAVWLGGSTTAQNFPTTADAVQPVFLGAGSQEGFLVKLAGAGAPVTYATYIGSSGYDAITHLAVDINGSVYAAGTSAFAPFGNTIGFRRGGEFLVRIDAPGDGLIHSIAMPTGFGAQALIAGGVDDVTLAGGAGLVSHLQLADLTPLSLTAITNAATGLPSLRVAPGECVTLFAQGVGASGSPQVFFDTFPAALLYTGSDQINLLVPFEIAGQNSTHLRVVAGSQTAYNADIAVLPSQPDIFRSAGSTAAAAFNQDGTVNSAAHPATPGSIVTLWVSGAGMFSSFTADGSAVAVKGPYPALAQPLSVTAGGAAAKLLYGGAAPGSVAGLVQVNFQLPPAVTGPSVPLAVTVGNWTSRAAQLYLAGH